MKPDTRRKVVVVGVDGLSTTIVLNALRERFGEVVAVIEDGEPVRKFLRRRVRLLGWRQTAGQVAFMLYARLGVWLARERRSELIASFDTREFTGDAIRRVGSINSIEARRLLRGLVPKVVVVSGTRIISAKTLAAVNVPFINIHAGITPGFRGVHGGYWALAARVRQDCGVTVHRVDAGVDTGAVLAQARIAPASCDNFFTYPLLQMQAGLPLLLQAVEDACADKLLEADSICASPSRQWYHPTLWIYLRNGRTRGVW